MHTKLQDLIFLAIQNDIDSLFFESENNTMDTKLSFEVLKTISYFIDKGLEAGSKVAIQSKNPRRQISVFFASQILGLVFVPLDVNYPEKTKSNILKDLQTDIFIDDDINLNVSCISKEILAENLLCAERNENDLSTILFTSGTTSNKPKGVMLSYSTLFKSALTIAEHYNWNHLDTVLNLADIHTMSGLRNSFIVPLITKSKLVLLDKKESSSFVKIIEQIYKFQISILLTSPLLIKQINMFSNRIEKRKFNSLKYIMTTGNSLLKEEHIKFNQYFNIPIYNYYGLTETAGICIGFTPNNENIDNEYLGYPLNSEVAIYKFINHDTGLLKIKNNHMLGYYKNNKLTNKVLKDAWFYTTDVVQIAKDGLIKFIGREDDAFSLENTELVFPQEIEKIVNLHDLVSESCVFQYATKLGFMQMALAVVGNIEDSNILLQEVNRLIIEHLGKTKIITKIFLLENLPKSNYNKLNRKKIKEILYDRL